MFIFMGHRISRRKRGNTRVAIAIVSSFIASPAPAHLNALDVQASLYCLAHSRYKYIEHAVKNVRLNATENTVSRPNERHLFVFIARNKGLHDGFDIWVFGTGRNKRYEIVNNGSFSLDHKRVKWVGPILGGAWTQDDFENNFRAALRHKPYRVNVTAYLPPQAVCYSYADKTDYR